LNFATLHCYVLLASMDTPVLEAAKKLTVGFGSDSCMLFLVDGADSASLSHALDARFALNGTAFFLTQPGGTEIVPLTASLPNGLTLTLNVHHAVVGVVAPLAPSPKGSSRPAAASSAPFEQQPSSPRAVPLLPPAEAQAFPRAISPREVGLFEAISGSLQMNEINPASGMNRQCSGGIDRMETMRSSAHMEMVEAIDRSSRLTTDLANERTLLAWTRTGMAAMRTALAIADLKTAHTIWLLDLVVGQISMALLFLVASVLGVMRYVRIKNITYQVIPDQRFGRLSIHYYTVLLVVGTLALASGQLARAWT